jgi:hypothetical protein
MSLSGGLLLVDGDAGWLRVGFGEVVVVVVVGEWVGRVGGARRGRGRGPDWVLGVGVSMALSARITTTCVALHDRHM